MKLGSSPSSSYAVTILLVGVKADNLNVTAISAANGLSTIECWSPSTAPSDFGGAVNYPIDRDIQSRLTPVVDSNKKVNFSFTSTVLPRTISLMISHPMVIIMNVYEAGLATPTAPESTCG